MNDLNDYVKAGGRSMTVFGVIAIILGLLALLSPGLTGFSILTFIGVVVLVGGIIRMLWAFRAGSLERGIWTFVIGLLTLLCGIVILANPLFAAGLLTVLLVIYFLLDGIFELVAGLSLRPARGSGWLIFGGIVSILLGIMIWRQFPLAGLWAIGILFGIKLFFIGLIMVAGGSIVRSAVKR